jgi:hypothetical protein
MQLPVEDRQIMLSGTPFMQLEEKQLQVVVHPGKHWPSKTFPKSWWDRVLRELVRLRITPILIGSDMGDKRGTVEVDATGCIDLRNRTSFGHLAWILQRCKVLLTNDSSPMHIAASVDPKDRHKTGNAWIGYIATCKHPDFITHWRHGEFQWREVNHSTGGVWAMHDFIPNFQGTLPIDDATKDLVESWLPDPLEYAGWAAEKLISASLPNFPFR